MQQARLAIFPPGEAKEDWKILRALSEQIGKRLPYDTLAQLRQRMVALNAIFARPDEVMPAAWGSFGTPGAVETTPFKSTIANFHMTCAISRASETMAKCTASRNAALNPRTGTDG